MLRDAKVTVSFAVKDLSEAKGFYTDKLGLDVDGNKYPGMLILNFKNDYQVFIYEKKDQHPASYTLINFEVDDIAKAMTELTARGVKFEHYDRPDCKTDEQGVVDYGIMKIAFFNDPSGNNHAVLQKT